MISKRITCYPIVLLLFLLLPKFLPAEATSFYPNEDFKKKAGILECREGMNFTTGVFPFYGDGDSLRLVVATQIENQAMQFVKHDEVMTAALEFSMYFRNEEKEFVFSKTWSESLKVRSEAEVRTRVKSIFQVLMNVPPGKASFSNEMSDANSERSGIIEPVRLVLGPPEGKLPVFGPYPFYAPPETEEGEVCLVDSVSKVDKLLLNPGKSFGYGLENIGFYVEFYREGKAPAETLTLKPSVRFEDGLKKELEETLVVAPGISSLSVFLKPGMVGLGEGVFRIDILDRRKNMVSSDSTFFFITLTEEWMLTEYDGAIKYLDYILTSNEKKAFETVSPEERRDLWKSFWQERDPIPATPQNERLVEYFRRVQIANALYTHPILEGWKTDRGKALILLGPPDEAYLREEGRNLERYEVWIYSQSLGFQLTLYFLDKGMTGLYWLTNETDLEQALSRMRQR